ncbi:MAG: hypothetical protein PVI90_11660 [Desulfobacteraceae bacterium]|jgi:hypothetical protein
MIANCEEIYEKYRTADFEDRLYIYLQFPELRNDFFKIDQTENHTDFFKSVNHHNKVHGFWRRIIDRIFGTFF